jgi:hypothetical protein
VPWWDKRQVNLRRDIIGMPAYVGMYCETPATNAYDTVTPLAAVLGATWADRS